MNGKLRKILLFGTLVGAISLGFQNCDSSQSHIQSSVINKINFFNYPFTSAPKFYGDILLLKPKGAIEDLNQFKFVGTVSHTTESTASISYDVRIQNSQGATICPTQTGTLLAGQSTLMFDCASLDKPDQAKVLFKVTSGNKTHTFEKTF